MSVCLTKQGEALIAKLFADGKPLTIDSFLFAYVEGLDPAKEIDPTAPAPPKIVHKASIPDEWRAFINPNQVVYSCLIGSDVGDFSFNWQGLYCSEYDTLVAVSSFPTLTSLRYDPNTNAAGNNLTRNFMLEFTGAQRLTQISIEAKVWQLDFTIRLQGIDERERLSNRDIYGRAAFLGQGWKLVEKVNKTSGATEYELLAGVGYVEGIRVELKKNLAVVPNTKPCTVWLDVCLEPEGSDVAAKAQILFLAIDKKLEDYISPSPYRIPHYCVPIAHIGEKDAPKNVLPGWGNDTFFGLTLNRQGELVMVKAEYDDFIEKPENYKAPSILPNDTTFTINEHKQLIMHLP